jgi:hypothetical protein
MEAASSFETLVTICKSIRRHISVHLCSYPLLRERTPYIYLPCFFFPVADSKLVINYILCDMWVLNSCVSENSSLVLYYITSVSK